MAIGKIQHFIPTVEQARKMWTIINEVGNGYYSALRSPGITAAYAAYVTTYGAVYAHGRGVSSTYYGVRPALKLNRDSYIFKSQNESFKLEPGAEFKIGLKYDLLNSQYNWEDDEIDRQWMEKRPYNGKEISYRVEYIDEKTGEVWVMPTLPITFGRMYNSEKYGVGPCNYDKVIIAEEKRFEMAALKFVERQNSKTKTRGMIKNMIHKGVGVARTLKDRVRDSRS